MDPLQGYEFGVRRKGMARIFTRFLILLPVVTLFLTACAAQKDIIYLNNQVNALHRQAKQDEKRFDQSIQGLEERIKASELRQSEIENQTRDRVEKTLKQDQDRFYLCFQVHFCIYISRLDCK